MLLRSVWRAALAATALAPSSVYVHADDEKDPGGQSTFISPSKDIGFALTIPQEDYNDDGFLFSLRVNKRNAWGAVGLGANHEMKGALMLMIYRSDNGENVTLSPRIGYGNFEPQFYDEFKYSVVANSTGVFGDNMYFTAKCLEHCHNWIGGWITMTSDSTKAIYAIGPKDSGFRSDSPSAGLQYHREYGQFVIDMKRTQGVLDAPVLTKDSENEGTTLTNHSKSDKSDYKAALHATFMLFSLVFLANFGVVLLRVAGWAKWHAVNQMFVAVLMLVGLAMGILTSFHYQRSRSFNHYHQILGYIIVAFVLGQLGLGVMHHLEYQKTQHATKYGRIHMWLGRGIIFLAIINGFFGFSFALNRKYGMVYAGLLILCAAAILIFLFWQNKKQRRQRFQTGAATGGQTNPPPWRESTTYSSTFHSEPPPGYEVPPQQVGLQPTSSSSANSPWKSSQDKDFDDDPDPSLGAAQRPREFA